MLIGTKVYIYKTIMFRVYSNQMSVTMATVIAPYMTYAITYSRSHFLMSSRFSAGAGRGDRVGRCNCAVVGRPTNFDNSRARAYCVYLRLTVV